MLARTTALHTHTHACTHAWLTNVYVGLPDEWAKECVFMWVLLRYGIMFSIVIEYRVEFQM